MRTALVALATSFSLTQLAAQQGPPPAVQWFPAAAAKPGVTWQQLLNNATMSLGRYRLAAGATDGQSPHDRDEVYCVLSGLAKFTAAGETRGVAPGDAVFVAARAEHRFHDITEDLDLLVFFSEARPATGGMVVGPKPTEQDAVSGGQPARQHAASSTGMVPTRRARSRSTTASRVGMAATSRSWKKPSKPRWRFGENFWTTLDTNMDLVLGGVEVPTGYYYIVVQHHERGLELVLLDPAEIRKQHLDAYEAPKTTGGIRVPLAAVRPLCARRACSSRFDCRPAVRRTRARSRSGFGRTS